MADGAPSFRPEDYSLGARLEALLDILAGEGLVVGPRERTAAHLLAVRAMESEGSSGGHEAMSPEAERAMLAKMAPVLAPLLARTREERERFLRVMATLYPPEVRDKIGDSVTPEREAAPGLWQWARNNWVRLAALAALLVAIAIAVVTLFPANDQKPVQSIPGAELPSDIELTSPIAETPLPEQPQQRPPQKPDDLLGRVMAAANQHDGAPTLREIAQTVALDEESLAVGNTMTGPAYARVATFETFSSAAFSPDGSRIAIVPYDNTVNVLDASSGTSFAVLSGHAGPVLSVAFSPDGSRIATGSGDGAARIWDTSTGASLAVLSGHSEAVLSAVFSPDGASVVTGSSDSTARIWDARTGASLVTLSGHSRRVWYAAFSPDGGRVVTASDDATVRIWDARSGASLAVLSGHAGTIYSAIFSPDGSRIVSNGEDGVRMWDARTGASLPISVGDSDAVRSIAFVQGRARAATASDDNSVRVWDADSGASLAVLSGHSDRIRSVTFSTDGTYIVTTSVDGTARAWDTNSGASLGVLSAESGSIQGVVLSPAGRRILTASDVDTAMLWEPLDGAAVPAAWTAATYAERLSELTGLPIDRPLALHGLAAGEGRGLLWARIAQALGRIEQPGLEPTLGELEAQAETWLASAPRPRAYRILDQLPGVYPRPESLMGENGAPLTPGAIATDLIAGDATRAEAARIGEGPGEDIARAFGMAGYPTGAFGRLPWEPPAVRPASSPPPGWLPWVALALPLLAALWLARSLFLMRPYLRRRPPRIPPTHTELVSEAGKRAATDAGHFQRIAQRLRVRTSRPSSELDISATIAATLKSGGLVIEPVHARARARPDYLVLVERMAAGDHDAMRMQRLVERLSDLVDLDIYAFQYDPGEIEPWGGGRRISIEEAQARHSDHRLIVLGTGAGFLDPLTLEPREAAAKLMYWQRRVLLTPVPLAEWSREEYALAEGLAMPVGRATAEGLQFLAELLGLEGGEADPQPDPRGDGLARPLPEMLRLRPQRFLFNNPPGKATVEELMAELHNVLTPAEFDWFAALAVYPTIQWDLTLFLGVYLPLRETDAVVLDPADGPSELQKLHAPAEPLYGEQRLAAIAQMPWLRLGRMPNWLRTRLIAELSPKRAAQVKAVLQKALESSRLRESATKEEEAVFRIAEDRVRNEPRKEALPPERVFDDDVLLDFLARSNRGDFSVPRLPKIDGRFLRDIWRRLGGPVGLAGLAALAFGVAGFALAPRGPDAVMTGAYGPLFLLIVGAVLAAALWRPETMGRRLAAVLERLAPGAFAVGCATLPVVLMQMTSFATPLQDMMFGSSDAEAALVPIAYQGWRLPLVVLLLSTLCGAFLLLGRWLGERLRLRIYAPPLNSLAAWLFFVGKSVALGAIAFVLVRLSGSGTPVSMSVTWPLAALVIAAAGVALARFAPEADVKSQGQGEREPSSGWIPLVLRGALATVPIGAAVALSLSVASSHHRAAIVAGDGDRAVAMRAERVAIAPGGEAIVSADAAGRVVLSRADGSLLSQASAQAPLSALAVDGAEDAWHVAFADADGRVFLWPAGSAPQLVEHDGAVIQSRGAPAQLALSPDGGLLAAVEAINAEGRGETRVVAIGASPAAATLSAPPAAIAELGDGAWVLATLDGGMHRITASAGAALQTEAFGWAADAATVRPPIRQIQVADATRLTAVGIDGSLMQATAADSVWSDLTRAGTSPALALGPAEIWRNAPAATGSAAAPVQTQPDRRVATGPWPQNADAVFEEAMQFVLKWEAGYVDSPNDSDGRSKFGITQGSYDAYREKEGLEPAEVRDASAEEARDIYRIGFWDAVSAEDMPNEALAIFLLDTAVNHGTTGAIRILQTAIGQREDGKVGPVTLARARDMSRSDPAGLFNNLFAARERFLRTIVERTPSQQTFMQGWLRRLTDLRQFLQPRIDRLTPAAAPATPPPQQQVVQQQAGCAAPQQATIYFELDRATINATNQSMIDSMLARASSGGCVVGPVQLTGTIDPNDENSSAFATSRVTALRLTLISAGVDAALIESSVEPDRQQVSQNDISEPLNRRVTITMSSVPPAEPEPVLTAGTTFRDRIRSAPQTAVPEMRVIPAGSFQMGSPDTEAGREDDETLPASVRIPASFAVSVTEVTWDEYLACVNADACQMPVSDMGWGRGDMPVVTVSWTDARAYVAWLSSATGQSYRLLTEAEWEYAARAGSTTAYPWGSTASHEYANYGADGEREGGISRGRDRWVNTSPVGSFPANDFGLHDMHGNLYEWVEDCYEQKPSLNPRPMQRPGCTNHVLRGGSWFDAPRWIRSADRYYGGVNQRNENFGIRVARDIARAPSAVR